MRAPLRTLWEHYRGYHDMDRPLLQWIGVVGCVAFPLFYVVRLAAAGNGYDDLPLRLLAAALCLGLALRRWWPAPLRRWYIAYSWLVVFYCLAFLLAYTMLMNHGGTPFVVNMVIGAVLIVLLADWRNTIAMLVLGYVLALAAHWLNDPAPALPREFVFAAAGSLLIVVGGALSHQGQQRVELRRMQLLYAGLAGSIAHEMRNPLAQVRHALDSIAGALPAAGGGVDLPPERVAALLATVQQGREAVSRGQQAIDLTLQQLLPTELDPARLRVLDAAACVRRAVDSYAYEDAGQRARVQVRVDGDFRFRGDPTALDLVLFNLLKNALYYVPLRPGMQVTFTVAQRPVPRIEVHDTGPGIPAEFMPRLFQDFQTHGKREGTGLGLAFCRRVMRSLGGDIRCRSAPGSTAFTLVFPPLADSDLLPAPAPAPTAAPERLHGRTVLVVDDQPLNRAIAGSMAAELGLHVREAEHGHQALELLRTEPLPDLVLMDVNMPGLNGIEATRALRRLPAPAGGLPVVAITANTAPPVLQAAHDAGVQAVLGKPIDREQFARTLGALLAAPPASPPAVARADSAGPDEVLNRRRLEDFRRLGMLHDLLPGALRDLRLRLHEVRRCVASGEVEGARQALHTFLGLAGEAGAQALHRAARTHYAALLDGTGPAGAGWLDTLEQRLDEAQALLAREYGVQPAGDQTSSHSLRV